MNTPDSYINFGCPFYQSSDHAIFTDGLMNHEQPQPKQESSKTRGKDINNFFHMPMVC